MSCTQQAVKSTSLIAVLLVTPHMPMLLNYDVLVAVMSCCDRGDTGRMMRTCRTLYEAGVPYLLHGTIKVPSRARFISLCRFVLHDPSHRSRHLRDLDLRFTGSFKTPDADRLVAGLFEHTTSLETLRLAYQSLVPLGEQVLRAICALNSVRTLTLYDACDESYTLLERMQAPLRSVEMNFYNDWADDPADPVAVFARFKDTLQEMHVTWVQFALPTIPYPNLTTLYVDDCRFAEIELIFRSFPNLRNLSLWMGQEDDDLDDDEIEAHRRLNFESQEHGRWESLQSISSSLLSLYMLGVRSKVASLSLDSGFLEAGDGEKLSVMLADLRPSSLSLRLRVPDFDPSDLCHYMVPAKDTLTSLLLNLEIREGDGLDPITMIRATASSLSTLRIRTLHVRVDESPYSTDQQDTESGASAEEVLESRSESLERSSSHPEDLTSLARDIARSVPSLEYICIDLEPRRQMWRLVGGPGTQQRRVLELPEDEEWRIIFGSASR